MRISEAVRKHLVDTKASMRSARHLLVMAKSPVPGRVKTRLCPPLSPIEAAVRVVPEDWPPFAKPAWMRIDRIKDEPGLEDFVDPLDRDAINA